MIEVAIMICEDDSGDEFYMYYGDNISSAEFRSVEEAQADAEKHGYVVVEEEGYDE